MTEAPKDAEIRVLNGYRIIVLSTQAMLENLGVDTESVNDLEIDTLEGLATRMERLSDMMNKKPLSLGERPNTLRGDYATYY